MSRTPSLTRTSLPLVPPLPSPTSFQVTPSGPVMQTIAAGQADASRLFQLKLSERPVSSPTDVSFEMSEFEKLYVSLPFPSAAPSTSTLVTCASPVPPSADP